jgi:hypothetical protein
MNDNPVVTIAAFLFIWSALVVIFVTILIAFNNIPIEKVNATCASHSGVESVSDHVWGVLDGGATVVCKDGKAFALDS